MKGLYEYALPIAALLLGTLVFGLTKLQSWTFDRRHMKNGGDRTEQRRTSE